MRVHTALAVPRPAWVVFGVATLVVPSQVTVRAEDTRAPAPARTMDGGTPPAAPPAAAEGEVTADGGNAASVAAPSARTADGGAPVPGPGPTPPADRGSSVATMQCARVSAAPARVRCTVEAQVSGGESIGWADAVLVTTPPFVEALRGRLGPHDATDRDATKWRWELGLVARGSGEGAVGGRVRLVVCMKGTCVPRVLPFQGHIAVGE